MRIKCDDPSAMYVLGKKFGAEPRIEAAKLLSLAKSLNLNVIGVSFHIGSGCMNYTVYQKAIESAKNVFKIGSALGYRFHFLDIGGGFPGERNDDILEVKFIMHSITSWDIWKYFFASIDDRYYYII